MAGTPRAAAGDDDIIWPAPKSELSAAEKALRKAIAATPVEAPSRPLSRRAASVWGR